MLALLVAFCRVLGRSGLDFGGFREGPGRAWEAFGAYFRSFSMRMRLHFENALNATKPQFLRCFVAFASIAQQARSSENSFQEPFEWNFPQRLHQKSLWELSGLDFARVLGPFGRLWGVTWASFGPSWAL